MLPSDVSANSGDIADISEEKAPIGLDLMGGSAKGVTVFPNPSNDHIIISVAGKARDKKSIVIYNSSGKQVFAMGNRAENTFMVDVSGFRKDIYFIEVFSGNQGYRKKWAKR